LATYYLPPGDLLLATYYLPLGDLLLAFSNKIKLIPKMNEGDCNMNMSNSVENTQTNTQSNMVDWFDGPRAIKVTALKTLLSLLQKREKSNRANRDKRLEDLYEIRYQKTLNINERIQFVKDYQLIWDNYSKEWETLKTYTIRIWNHTCNCFPEVLLI
jgi:hypothetical protein